MNRKGFTLTELLAVIVILGIIGMIAAVSYSAYVDSSKKDAYEDAEKSMKAATESMYTYCSAQNSNASFCKTYPDYNQTETTTLEELINAGFMSRVADVSNKGTYCTGYVAVTNNSTNNVSLEYKVCLKCSGYQSSGCK